MKRLFVIFILIAFAGVVAFASLNSKSQKTDVQKTEVKKTEKLLRLLNENNGYLPYNDKSDPEDIYEFFGMSKKTFKMATGALYKQRKIQFAKEGIVLIEQ